ncbi:MAG TPA: aminomethyl-transferring glycine dehydrogenase subunit GcvPA [Acidobacteria bacterium]|nr:aminomethyl-transferring glycine dehydrogenase subunit GcvPA [Acidobacteriota bacterium]
MHPWIGAGPEDRERILGELGLDSIDDLFSTIPPEVSLKRLDLPPALDEETLMGHLGQLAADITPADGMPCFLGAGVYRHVLPSLVGAVLGRAEFFTSYTPYQPEISQGTLQAIFEFQTMICQLTGLEVANASLYDGATAVVEAALMAHRVLRGKRNRVVVAETVHPVYRRVLDTYTRALGIEVVEVPPGEDGTTPAERLAEAAGDAACCVIVQSPSFTGVVEDLPAVAEAAHGAGALAVEVVAEAVSLGVLAGGGAHGFDIVCGEAQSFGMAPSFGGPHLGFFACRQKHMRQMPGRLVGQTVDADGRRAFCLTLSTREQHIRRAKATSNICSNHGLMALAATVWLELLGGDGLRRVAVASLSAAEEFKRRLAGLDRWELAFPDAPAFNELLVTGPGSGEELARALDDAGILAGVPSRRFGGSWPDGLLMAFTERTTAADLDALLDAMGRIA